MTERSNASATIPSAGRSTRTCGAASLVPVPPVSVRDDLRAVSERHARARCRRRSAHARLLGRQKVARHRALRGRAGRHRARRAAPGRLRAPAAARGSRGRPLRRRGRRPPHRHAANSATTTRAPPQAGHGGGERIVVRVRRPPGPRPACTRRRGCRHRRQRPPRPARTPRALRGRQPATAMEPGTTWRTKAAGSHDLRCQRLDTLPEPVICFLSSGSPL